MVDIVKDWNDEYVWVGKRDYPEPADAVAAVDMDTGLTEYDDPLLNPPDHIPVYVTVTENRLRHCVASSFCGVDETAHWHPEPENKYASPVWQIQAVEQEWADEFGSALRGGE